MTIASLYTSSDAPEWWEVSAKFKSECFEVPRTRMLIDDPSAGPRSSGRSPAFALTPPSKLAKKKLMGQLGRNQGGTRRQGGLYDVARKSGLSRAGTASRSNQKTEKALDAGAPRLTESAKRSAIDF